MNESGKCPGCGKGNDCALARGEAGGCWCASLGALPEGSLAAGSADPAACLCQVCLPKFSPASIFDNDGALTREYLLNRGTCCGNKCRNCPFGWVAVKE